MKKWEELTNSERENFEEYIDKKEYIDFIFKNGIIPFGYYKRKYEALCKLKEIERGDE